LIEAVRTAARTFPHARSHADALVMVVAGRRQLLLLIVAGMMIRSVQRAIASSAGFD
jgi:hypothetical protein